MLQCLGSRLPGFNAVQNNTSLKHLWHCQQSSTRFNAVQNNTSLKLMAIFSLLKHCFNAVQNNTSLKPQIQKSDRFFHFKARILFRITTP